MFKGTATPSTLVRFQVRMFDHMTFYTILVGFIPAKDARKLPVLFRHELFKFLFPKVGSNKAVGFRLFSLGGKMHDGHMLVQITETFKRFAASRALIRPCVRVSDHVFS